ncbi:MAG: DUF1826 domain-containing protein [Leptospiraceae bacterium]|nr:DUF1826 domain-containing protein [Leptospiraceae bacterium]
MAGLFNIQKSNKNIATFSRRSLSTFKERLAAVEWPDTLRISGEFELKSADDSLMKMEAEFSHNLEFMKGDIKKDLIADILNLADFFQCFELKKKFQYSFDVLCLTMCPKFHIDYYSLRLIVTYIGKATQWTANSNIIINNTDHEILPFDVIDQNKYYDLKPMDITLLKGCNFAYNHQGVVHRSPGSDNQKRVLLRFEY